MKTHILFQYKTQELKTKKQDSTTLTFATEVSDRDDFNAKRDTTILIETVETSDENEWS